MMKPLDIARYSKKYRLSHALLKSYQDADTVLELHSKDPSLASIPIKLCKPPSPDMIWNFGLEPNDQVFRYEKIPKRLQLENLKPEIDRWWRMREDSSSVKRQLGRIDKEQIPNIEIKQIRQFLDENQHLYIEELEWIREQWYYRFFGKWFYINGKPIWVSPFHWWYLNYHTFVTDVDESRSKPEFRIKDWKLFTAIHYFYHLTIDENGFELPMPDHLDLINKSTDGRFKGIRPILGMNIVDARRGGKTEKASSIIVDLFGIIRNFNGLVQGLDGTQSEKIYNTNVRPQYLDLPFWFQYEQLKDSLSTALVNEAKALDGGSRGFVKDLRVTTNAKVTFGKSAKDSVGRGNTYHIIYNDELGATVLESVKARHETYRPTLSKGGRRVGFAIYTTTVDKINNNNVREYVELCKLSHYNSKVKKSTVSGVVNYFDPEGSEGFYDKFGYPVLRTPTEEQSRFIGRNIGYYEWLDEQEQAYLDLGDYAALAAQKRNYPRTWDEVFMPDVFDVMFNREQLQSRYTFLITQNYYKRVNKIGRLEWVDGNRGSNVRFVEDEKFGSWYINSMPMDGTSNHVWLDKRMNKLRPMYYNNGVVATDGYQFGKKKSDRAISDGGIAVFRKRDVMIDPEDNPKKWHTHKFYATYLARPDSLTEGTTYKFSEEVLKAAIFWGFPIFPETNVPDVHQHITDWGYEQFFYYMATMKKGQLVVAENPGWRTTALTQPELASRSKNYIDIHTDKIDDPRQLEQYLKFMRLSDQTHFDLYTATAGALLSLDSQYGYYKDLLGSINTKKPQYKMDGIFSF